MNVVSNKNGTLPKARCKYPNNILLVSEFIEQAKEIELDAVGGTESWLLMLSASM
jgi:hypothetical protein